MNPDSPMPLTLLQTDIELLDQEFKKCKKEEMMEYLLYLSREPLYLLHWMWPLSIGLEGQYTQSIKQGWEECVLTSSNSELIHLFILLYIHVTKSLSLMFPTTSIRLDSMLGMDSLHPSTILTSLRKQNLPDLRNWIWSVSKTSGSRAWRQCREQWFPTVIQPLLQVICHLLLPSPCPLAAPVLVLAIHLSEATEQAIHLRAVLLILARSVEQRNTCHYPLKGCRQGKKMMRWRGQVYLAWDICRTGLQGKDQENLTGVLWWQLWPLYTTTVFIHVYTRSPIRDKRGYCYWSSKA